MAGIYAHLVLALVHGGHATAAKGGEPEEFKGHRHRVRGVLASTRASARDCAILDLVEVGVGHLPC